MFWSTARIELDELRRQTEQQDRDKEVARLDFRHSLKRLTDYLDQYPPDAAIAAAGGSRTGGRKDQ